MYALNDRALRNANAIGSKECPLLLREIVLTEGTDLVHGV
ncbi:hypothetical protein CEV34_2845 [Brucella pseudogrignonensis]|uniref:Uncharacterized protein n=1 Tax=Brucella pseudogrignonensis TaxID=419475 RepID=A0A256GDU7_9HYPH|nr:hypothetical protein CEV34_2845 [Brucella pseudogrignonensis]